MSETFPVISVPDCDAANPSVYVLRFDGDQPVYGCRCIVCARCEHHTGNSSQGHFWALCKAADMRIRRFHFCCPGDCELEAGAV